jgi:hypothetical protein
MGLSKWHLTETLSNTDVLQEIWQLVDPGKLVTVIVSHLHLIFKGLHNLCTKR